MTRTVIVGIGLAALLGAAAPSSLAVGVEIIPAAENIKADHPRLFHRPRTTP